LNLNRVELSDIHHPRALAKAVHDQLGPVECSIPVVRIAKELGIGEVRLCAFDGLEGMLLTDRVHSRGSILANTLKGNRRANFTVAHELGHFLLERHLFERTGFTCSAADMRVNAGSSRHQRQEAEANEFAISLLAPPYRVLPMLGSTPDLQDAVRLRNDLDISLEASVRLLIDFRAEPIAAIWSKGGRVRYFVTSRAFPSVSVKRGAMLRAETAAAELIAGKVQRMSEVVKTPSTAWTMKQGIPMGEQTRLGRDGYAVTLLFCGPL